MILYGSRHYESLSLLPAEDLADGNTSLCDGFVRSCTERHVLPTVFTWHSKEWTLDDLPSKRVCIATRILWYCISWQVQLVQHSLACSSMVLALVAMLNMHDDR